MKYCGFNGKFANAKGTGATCSNVFECISNVCLDNECVPLKSQIEEQRGLLRTIACWFESIFGSQTFDECMAAGGN